MPEPLNIALAFRIDDDQIARIEALDPRVRILKLSQISGQKDPTELVKASLLEQMASAEVVLGPSRIPVEYFDAATGLRWFQCINAGIERMEQGGLLRRGFAVTTAAGLASVAIAEYVVGTMVMLAKDLHRFGRAQDERKWDFHFTRELAGKTVGILGLGEIGRETSRRARAFDMHVIASRRTVVAGASDPDADELFAHSDLDELLA
ncbi:MAG: NAD(P)-dependent oxidoreductase, partial [Tepidiformaceae bacterium]